LRQQSVAVGFIGLDGTGRQHGDCLRTGRFADCRAFRATDPLNNGSPHA
jgi:hypothetical protein